VRRWDPVADQGSRQQRRIAAAGAPEPPTAEVAGFEGYPRFYLKLRRGEVLDMGSSFEDLVRSARGGWAAGTTVTATHQAPDGHPVVFDGSATGSVCGSSRWVPEVTGGTVAEVVAALRTLRAFDALPAPGVQADVVEGSGVQRSQQAWLDGEVKPGVDGFRVECRRPAGHDGDCVARAQVGDLEWRWDRREQVIRP